jgi:biopolymer transport protein ExbB/TolQ
MLSTQISIYAMYAARFILALLALLSILSIAFFIERMFFFKRRFIKDFASMAGQIESTSCFEELASILSTHRTAETEIILRALNGPPESRATFTKRVNAHFLPEKEKWARYSTFLGSVGSNAPFIGLLGTVFGILKAFADLSLVASGGPQAVMAGISEALIATAAGLMVAIPAVVFFNLCRVKLNRAVTRLQSLVDHIGAKEFFDLEPAPGLQEKNPLARRTSIVQRTS